MNRRKVEGAEETRWVEAVVINLLTSGEYSQS
jgi:hypothetical protein